MSSNTLFTTSNKGSKNSSSVHKFNYFLMPLVVVLLIIPLVIHEYVYNNEYQQFPWYTNQAENLDFFLYYKSLLITIVGIVIILTLIYQHFTDKKIPKVRVWLIPLIAYGVLAIASAIATKYPNVVWRGGLEQFESTLVLLTYCLLLYYAYINVRNEQDIKTLLKFASIGIAIVTIIGAFQAIGFDLFRSNLGKKLISNVSSWPNLDSFEFQFEKNRVYTTLYNPNYVGVYASLLFPIAGGFTVFSDSKVKKIFSGILSLLLIICTFGAQSKTGLVVLIVTSIILLIILRKRIFKHTKIVVSVIVGIIALFLLLNVAQNFTYIKMIRNAFVGTESVKPLQEIEPTQDYIKVVYNEKKIFIVSELYEDGNLNCAFLDQDNNPYEVDYDSTTLTYTLRDPLFNSITLMPVYLDESGTFGCVITIDNNKWYFKGKVDETGYEYMNNYGNIDTFAYPNDSLFSNHGSLFTGRGYLWSRSIPLLKDSIFIGTGADTFGYLFPQNDYVGKANYGFLNTIITKPHNMYLQIGIQTGFLSLIAFLALYIMYLVDSIKTYRKCDYKTITEQIGILIVIGTVGYMISGLINDSTVTVAPLFWTIMGIGFACNRITREQRFRIEKIRNMT